jgi:hypothetical protein
MKQQYITWRNTPYLSKLQYNFNVTVILAFHKKLHELYVSPVIWCTSEDGLVWPTLIGVLTTCNQYKKTNLDNNLHLILICILRFAWRFLFTFVKFRGYCIEYLFRLLAASRLTNSYPAGQFLIQTFIKEDPWPSMSRSEILKTGPYRWCREWDE